MLRHGSPLSYIGGMTRTYAIGMAVLRLGLGSTDDSACDLAMAQGGVRKLDRRPARQSRGCRARVFRCNSSGILGLTMEPAMAAPKNLSRFVARRKRTRRASMSAKPSGRGRRDEMHRSRNAERGHSSGAMWAWLIPFVDCPIGLSGCVSDADRNAGKAGENRSCDRNLSYCC